MSQEHFALAGRAIGPAEPPYVIAEVGNNHAGDIAAAKVLIAAAADAGADAVKLQIYRAARFLARSSSYYERFLRNELSREGIAELMAFAVDRGTVLFASVFDEESAEIMEGLGAPFYKIASGDVTHLPLLRAVAAFGKPMIVSTGGATTEETALAVETIRAVRPETPIALLHCVSQYPTEPGQANLASMMDLRRRFGVPVGFSDHTIGTAVAIAAAALGAEIIEKHFTLDKMLEGPDHKLSADPDDMADLVAATRAAHAAIGRAEKAPVEPADFIPLIRRSITAQAAIPAGTEITAGMLEVKRPGTGIGPAHMGEVIGASAARDIAEDETLQWEAIAR